MYVIPKARLRYIKYTYRWQTGVQIMTSAVPGSAVRFGYVHRLGRSSIAGTIDIGLQRSMPPTNQTPTVIIGTVHATSRRSCQLQDCDLTYGLADDTFLGVRAGMRVTIALLHPFEGGRKLRWGSSRTKSPSRQRCLGFPLLYALSTLMVDVRLYLKSPAMYYNA